MIIIGAGLSGCIAALLNPEAVVLEAGAPGRSEHQAVLRFRDPQIGKAIGIPFREVRVHKSCYWWGQHYARADVRMLNQYALKVTGGQLTTRSLSDLSTVQRWVAPPELHRLMVEQVGERVSFNCRVQSITPEHIQVDDANGHHRCPRAGVPIISTMPLRTLLLATQTPEPWPEFCHAPIHVTRWRIPNCDVHQTIYFPQPDLSLYRATLTGEHLIAETVTEEQPNVLWTTLVDAFGFNDVMPEFLLQQSQRFGKIVPVETEWRKRTLYQLTAQLNVYSLGRFALWSNILLDDVYNDLAKIRTMIALNNGYDLLKAHAQEPTK